MTWPWADGCTARKRCRRRVRGIIQGDPIGAVVERLFAPPSACVAGRGKSGRCLILGSGIPFR